MTTRASLQALALLCTTPAAYAVNLYWDNVGGTANDWSSLPNWSTVVGGGTDPVAVPGSADLAIFSATSVAAGQTVNLNAARSVTGLSFTSGQAHSLLGGGTNQNLTVGASGIDKTGTGAVTIGSATAGQQVPVILTGAQTWTNSNNTGAIVVQNTVTPQNAASGTTLTLGGTSTAANQINGVIANNTGTGVTSITKSGAGLWVLGNTTTAVANTFTGNVTINAGTLRVDRPTAVATLTTLGTGTVAVNSGGTLHFFTTSTANALTHANNLALSSGTIFYEDGNTVLSGTVGLTGNNTIRGRYDDKNLTMSGVVSGTGGITKINTTATGAVELILSGANTYSSNATGGVLTVNGGYVRLANAGALGSTPTIFANNTQAASSIGVRLAGGINIGAGRTLILRNGPNVANDQRAVLDNISGNNTWSGSIILESPVAGVRNQTLSAASGTTLTVNGNVYNSASLPSAGMFVRGSGSGVMNGNFSLGSAMFIKTDGGTWTLNSTGNTQGSTTLANGGIVVGTTNALESNKPLILGEGNSNSGTLTINGGFTQHFGSIASATGSNGAHVITGAGSLDTGSVAVPVTLVDGSAADDLSIASAITGSGGITKSGAGTLHLNGATASGPVAVTAGNLRGNATLNGGLSIGTGVTLTPGTATAPGTITTNALALSNGTLAVNLGSGGNDVINVTSPGGLTQSGATNVTVSGIGALTNSTFYPIISYTGSSPGAGGFALSGALPGRAAGTITDNGSAIGLSVTNDKVRWTGANGATWDINTTQNWRTVTGDAATNYLQGDDLIFTDAGANTSITLGVAVTPMAVDFQNTSGGPAYTLSGAGALTGSMPFTKSGTGTVTLAGSAAHTYTGATSVNAGTLAINPATSSLTGTSGVNVASGATLRLFADNSNFTFNRALSGSGAVVADPNAAGTAGSRDITISGNNSGFTGTLSLQPSGTVAANGSMRTVAATNQANLGSGTIQVKDGAQLWHTGALSNPIEVTGTGYSEGAGGTPHASTGFTYGGIGAIRMEGTLSGAITLVGNAKLMPYNSTQTISGPIGGTGMLVAGGSSNAVNSTLILTGTNNWNGATWINGANTAGGSGTDALIVGNNTTTGSLGTGDVTLNASASRGALIRFARSDGYTLGAGQDIQANVVASADHARTSVSVNATGAGLSLNGNTIDLSDGTIGGSLFVAGQAGGSAMNGSVLNIDGAIVDVGYFSVGEVSGSGGTVNQSGPGSSTTVLTNLRVGHYGSETSTYNLVNGSVNLTAANPGTNPFTGGATEQNGGIYLGIDGTGLFTQSGGTVNTNFVVLDNRGDTAGVDQYNLNGGTLNIKNTWGISGNASTLFTLGGGTLRIDNAGPVTVPVSVPSTVTGAGSILDTVSSGNAFTFSNNIAGSGTVTTQGGGTLNLTTTGTQNVSAVIAGTSPLTKLGAGTTTLAGANTYNGATTVSAGRLDVTGSIANSALSLANTTQLGGEGTAASVTLGATGTDTTGLFVNGITAGALTSTGTLIVNGTVNVTLTGAPASPGPITVLNHGGTAATAANFTLTNAATYRGSTFTVGANDVTVDIDKDSLVWDGSTATWEIAGTDNDWNDTANDNFFIGDSVTFNDSLVTGNQSIAMTGALQPTSVTFANTAFDYELTGTAGNGISGPASVSKTGEALVTLGGDNTFTGGLTISNGMVNIASATALGASGGQITVTAGGQLNYKGTNISTSGRTYSVTIAGDGADGFGDGAITNDTASLNQNGQIVNLTLSGNATIGTFGGTLPNGNRIDCGLGGTITGNGFTLTKTGDAMVAVRGPATNISYLVSQGTLRAEDSDLAFGSTGVQVNTGATLDSWSARTFAVPVTFQDGSTLTCSNSTANWTGPLSLQGDITVGGASTVNITQPFAETATGLFTKTGAGNVILPAGNTFSRKFNVTGGILRIPTNDALGTTPGSPLADAITLQGGGKIQAGNSTIGVDMTLDSNRGVFLASGDGGFHPWTGFTLTYGGSITGPGNLIKTDGGVLNFTGSATHTGGTTFSVGTTNLNAASITATSGFAITGGTTNLNGGSAVTVASVTPTPASTTVGTATFNVAGGSLTTQRFIIDEGSNTSSTVNHTAGTVTITGTDSTNSNQASFLFGHFGSNNTATYNLTGGTLNSNGAELSFGWDSTHSLFNQSGGTANLLGLDFGNGRNNNAVYSLNGGRLNIGANGITTNGNKTFNLGSGTLGAFANWSSGQAISMTGTVTPATVDTLDSVDGTTARTITLSGLLSGNGGLVKNGAGTLTLNRAGAASNTFSGGLTVNAGTVKLFGNNDAASVVGTGTLTINAGATVEANSHNTLGQGAGAALTPMVINSGTFLADEYNHLNSVTMTAGTLGIRSGVTQVDGIDMRTRNAVTPVITSLAHATTSASITSKVSLTNNTTLSVADGAVSSDLQISGAIGGVGTLTKTGTGTLEVTGVNTYTGATNVNAGTLLVNTGSLGNTAVTVATTGTLGGNGSIAGATTVQSGGTLAPGNSAGTLNFGSTLNLQAGSTYAVEITGAATHDKVVATGVLTANGTIAVTLGGYTPVAGNSFDIADASSITGTPTFNFTNAVLTAGLVWDTSAFATTGVISVVTDDPFTGWASFYGVTEGKGGDDDKDGESNLLEFATNSHPVNGASRARAYGKMHVLAGDTALTYTVAVRKNAVFAAGAPDASKREGTKDKVKYTIEASNELGIWNTVVVTELAPVDAAAVQAAITPALPALDADWEWHTFRTDGGAPADIRDFIRLSVAEAP
jgi:fibronectin-binding autotransporter adhesin